MFICEGLLIAVALILDGCLSVVVQGVGEISDTCIECSVGESWPAYSCTVQDDSTVRSEGCVKMLSDHGAWRVYRFESHHRIAGVVIGAANRYGIRISVCSRIL